MADQEKERQEEQMAGGPASAGASNKSAPPQQNSQSSEDTSKQSKQDYEALTKKRDLGTAGGGNIPGGVNTSNSTVESGASSSGENVGEGFSAERGSVKNSSTESEPTATNTTGQANNGGRHPSQPQTAMGDQDATQGRSGDEVTEPMSSRAPDKINQKQK